MSTLPDPSKAVGFFGVHRQAMENLLPIAEETRSLGGSPFFLSADEIFHQDTVPIITAAGFDFRPVTHRPLPRPLTLYHGLSRIPAMAAIVPALKEHARLARVWMVCGDNAPQRVVMETLGPNTFSVVIQDAIFAESRFTWELVRKNGTFGEQLAYLGRPFQTLALNTAIKGRVSWLLPGHSGHSAADVMVLAGRYNLDVVRASRGNVPLYWPIGLPRFAKDIRRSPEPRQSSKSLRLRVAVFPSAFDQHGHPEDQQIQNELMEDTSRALNEHSDRFEVVVKKHPRESNDFYEGLKDRYPNVCFDLTSPAAEVLYWTDVVITLMSSVALEALLWRKPAIMLGWRFPWWRMNGMPYAEPAFPRPNSPAALVDLLGSLRNETDLEHLVNRQAALRDYIFSPQSPESAARIAEALVAGLTGPEQARSQVVQLGAASL